MLDLENRTLGGAEYSKAGAELEVISLGPNVFNVLAPEFVPEHPNIGNDWEVWQEGSLLHHDPTMGDFMVDMGHDHVNSDDIDYDMYLANLVCESGDFNFRGLRIPLNTNWNTDLFSELLVGF